MELLTVLSDAATKNDQIPGLTEAMEMFARIIAPFAPHLGEELWHMVKKDTLEGPITYHDPCNIGRYGGIIEQPRNILKALTSEFVEMEPTGDLNFCCGGGGGLSATGDYGQLRLQIGKVKAEQIEKTGAKVVVTNCYNCLTQIGELNRKYKLGIKVKSIVEFVADSLDNGAPQA